MLMGVAKIIPLLQGAAAAPTDSAEVMSAGPRLRIIVTPTTGLNHIDLQTAKARGIQVLSLRGETAFLPDADRLADALHDAGRLVAHV